MILVREGLEEHLNPQTMLEQKWRVNEASPFYGRSPLSLLRLDDGDTALIRAYRHGGFLRRFTGDYFFSWPPRPFRELAVTLEARHRGVPTADVLAAWVKRTCGPLYRGWLITREIKGSDDLWAALQSNRYAEANGAALLQAAARSVRRMHRQGVYHGDLNLKNILVRREADQIKSYIIDFDKARLFPGEVPAKKARRNLARLLRSVGKLDPERRHLSRASWDLFIRFYNEEDAG